MSLSLELSTTSGHLLGEDDPASIHRPVLTSNRDKKLESWVKDSAFLGGAGKGEPTIVTPKQCTLT
jgi:hypothetical protein